MAKFLVEIVNSYGKCSGEELLELKVIEDLKDFRDIVLEYSWDEDDVDQKEIDKIISEQKGCTHVPLIGGDYDDPTGRTFTLHTYESKKAEIEEKYRKEIENLNKLFNK